MKRAGGDSLARLTALLCALSLALPPLTPPAFAQSKPRTIGNQKKEAAPAETVMLNFVNADIDAVVRAIGQYTNRTFVIDPRVKGTLSLITERPVTKQQAYEQLLSGLRLQGFTIVQTGNVMRVVPEADAKLQGGTVVGPNNASPGGDQLITQVFRLQYESATAMVPILRPLIAPNNTISAYPQNNTLVITDYAENLRRIQRIIESIDTPATSDLEMIPVKYGLAMEIASVVNRVLDEGARAAGQAVDAGQRISVLAEPRTNTLIVRAPSQARLTLAKNLIAQLDRPASTPGNINVVYLRNAEAVRLAPLLRAIISSDPSYTPPAGASGGLSQGGATGTAGGGGAGMSTPAATTTLGGGAAGGGGGGGGGGSGPLAGLIQADAATNSLIITAPEPLYRNIRAIIDKLDVRRAQVVIESLIVEMTADKAAEFGIQWQALGNVNNSDVGVIASQNFGGGGTNIIGTAANLGSVGQGLNLGVLNGKINIPGVGEVLNLAFLARALETTADANILSTPTIQTLDNEEAKFLVGQNIPIITGSYAAAGGATAVGVNPFQTFERKDIGLQLRVRPQISEGGVVRLAIYQELSSIQNTLTASQGGIITNKRSFESTVLVENGNIVVLGGLIEDRTDNSRSSLPILGRIPGLGYLFSYENRGRKKTNLLVFLRPYVVRDEGTSSELALDRYAYIRGQVAGNSVPDNFIFQGFKGRQLPETPQVPPTMQRLKETGNAAPTPLDGPSSAIPRAPDTASAGLGARVEPAPRSPAPALPQTAPQPSPQPLPAPPPAPTPSAPSSSAPPTAATSEVAASSPAAVAPMPPKDLPAPRPDTIAAAPASPEPRSASLPVPTATTSVSPPASTTAPSTPVERAAEAPSAPAVVAQAAAPADRAAVEPAPTVIAQAAPPAPEPIIPAPAPTPPPAAASSTPVVPTATVEPAPASVAPAMTSATAPSSSGAFAATPGATTGPASNLLQVAAVSEISRGRELQRQLRAAGFDAYWESVKNRKGTEIVRVRVSVDPATQSMAETVARLKAMGFDPIVVAP
jgi:general secretion pathway protein D